MRSVVRRAVAVLLVGFVVGGVAAWWPTAIVAAQTDPSVSPTPPPTVTGSKVTAVPTTTAPRPTTAPKGTSAPAPAPAPSASAAPGTKAAPAGAAAETVPAPSSAAAATAVPTTVAATTVAVTTVASTTEPTVTTTVAAAVNATSPPTTSGIGDAEASRRVRRISWTLVALAGGLLALTLWFWRTTRPVPVELGGLAVMGTHRWRRAPVPRRDDLVTRSRPARLGSGEELFVDPADVPALVSLDGSAPAVLGAALAEPAAAASIASSEAWVGDAAVPMLDVLPGAGPMTPADLGSLPTSSAAASSPVPPPPLALPAETPPAPPLVPTAEPAHLGAHSSAAVLSPPGSLVSEGSATGASRPPSTGTPLLGGASEPPAPAMPVELSPAIDGLSPLVEVVPSPDTGFVALEPIPADQYASGPAGDSAAQ